MVPEALGSLPATIGDFDADGDAAGSSPSSFRSNLQQKCPLSSVRPVI